MSIFGSIMHKIFSAAEATVISAAPAPIPPADAIATASAVSSPTTSPAAGTTASPATAPAQPIDVEAVLTRMAAEKGGGGNWQTSIVDLLKLLDLDSSMDARKALATEINVHVAADGSAEENIALHKAVMQKLAENGGKVPDSLKG